LNPAMGPGEHCKFSQWLRAVPGRQTSLMHLWSKIAPFFDFLVFEEPITYKTVVLYLL